jgi:AhpD family alkylhydroperoxidase
MARVQTHCAHRRIFRVVRILRRARAMMNRQQVYREVQEMLGRVPEWLKKMPDSVVVSFWSLYRDFDLSETVIPNKYKELIGLAVSGATRCKYCTLFHTEAAKMFGATEAEIAEAAAMGGLTMMASTWINAEQLDFDAFRKETLEIVKYVTARQGNGKQPQAHS